MIATRRKRQLEAAVAVRTRRPPADGDDGTGKRTTRVRI
jgi:hypothetical protein